MGCFFVGRVAESELIGAGKQWSLAVLSSQFLRDICEIYRGHGCKNSDHDTITILSEV